MILHSSFVSAFSLQLKTKSKISISQRRATASWYSFTLERRAKRVRERVVEEARKKQRETLVDIPIVFGLTLITFQLSAAWLSFVYSARDMPWLQLTMCESPESPAMDALPSRTLPDSSRLAHLPLPPSRTLLSRLIAACDVDGCLDWLDWGMICVAPKSENCAQTCCKRMAKKQSLNDVPPLAAYTERIRREQTRIRKQMH